MPDRGTIVVREAVAAERLDAPTLMLLHGWTATADLNFFTVYEPLARHFNLVAFDQRGHGDGLRSRRSFRLEDCADDAAAVADVLGIDRFIAVGYSMGGTIAQLLCHRHPERVAGLVLCATAAYFNGQRQERLSFLGLSGLAAVARLTPAQARLRITQQLYLQRKTASWEPWAIEQASRHDWRMVLEAGGALGRFSSREWIAELGKPTGVVITLRDTVVPVKRQLELLDAVPDAMAWRIDGGHDAVIANPDRFVPSLLEACSAISARADPAT